MSNNQAHHNDSIIKNQSENLTITGFDDNQHPHTTDDGNLTNLYQNHNAKPKIADNLETDDEQEELHQELPKSKIDIISQSLSNPKNRIFVIAGAVCLSILTIIVSTVLIGSNNKTGEGVYGSSNQPNIKVPENTQINEAQAQHIMKNQQGDANNLAQQGITNAPVLGTAGTAPTSNDPNTLSSSEIQQKYPNVNYKTVDILNLPEEERLPFANSFAVNYERDAYYGEDFSNTQLYSPGIKRGNQILTYTNRGITIRPSDYNARLEKAIAEEAGTNNTPKNNTGSTNNTANNANAENSQAYQDPNYDPTYERLSNDLRQQYDDYATTHNDHQTHIHQQQETARLHAEKEAEIRRQKASQSVKEAIADISGNRSSSGFVSQTYGQKYIKSGHQSSTSTSDNQTTNATTSNDNTKQSGNTKPELLPKHIIRAGTSYPIAIINSINSDYTTTVKARVVSGPFSGMSVYGQIEPNGRNIGISFTAIEPKNPRQALIPINAIALTYDGTGKIANANHHYLQNYLTMVAQSYIAGYGNAYANSGTTTTMNNQGVVVTQSQRADSRQIRGEIYASLADRLNQDVGVFANRPTTFTIAAGTMLNMTLISNLDTHQSTPSINVSNQGLTQSRQN